MSWLLAFLGFAALIILHELGHFVAAKAVGMRVERFALFFPPIVRSIRRGETEYALGSIPLGGYVRITGMNPNEEIPPQVAHRAYFRQPVWKRLVVIGAGPVVNIVLAFLLLWGLAMTVTGGQLSTTLNRVAAVEEGFPADGVLRPGDRIVAVDGERGTPNLLQAQIANHPCEGRPTAGCRATEPARVTVMRDGREQTFSIAPVYDATPKIEVMRLGFQFDRRLEPATPINAADASLEDMWSVTSLTVTKIVRIFDPEDRKDLSSVVGGYETTRQAIEFDTRRAIAVLALISLSLGVINLFPFLPLDGGHIFWALAEKFSGRRIPFAVMERAGLVGFVLVLMLFFVGLNNDIARLQGEGFGFR
jgi:regulator of sigma E protease